MTAILLEDEAIASRRMQRLLSELFPGEIKLVGAFDSIRPLAEYLTQHEQPDILFLDIMVADGNSFELFDLVKVKSNVIFVTAYDEFAIKAFRNNAVDYLLKPIKHELLIDAVSKVRPINLDAIESINREINPYKQRFLIRFGNKIHTIKTNDIAYIYSEDKLSFFIMKDGSRVSSDWRLQNIQEELNPDMFYRVNRQFIVHLDSLDKILRYSRSRLNLRLSPSFPKDIIISTENTPLFKKWLDR
ncbi:MAG: two-component system response regulator LytT [Patiriisocius sp.]|jgi:two-component system response regulator LytT